MSASHTVANFTVYAGNANRILRTSAGLAIVLLLSGCASLSKDQCMVADWRQIGYTDGVNGSHAARIDEHAKACAEYGVRPRLDEYLSGRKKGLLTYCRAENGFTLGRNGTQHNAADCPDPLRRAFLDQYQDGRQIHAIEVDLASYRNRVDSNNRQIYRNDERIGVIRRELSKNDLPRDRRKSLQEEYSRLTEQKDFLLRDNSQIQDDLARAQRRLNSKLREFGR